jgi:hypothetical protein
MMSDDKIASRRKIHRLGFILALLAIGLGSGLGYEIGWGWGLVATSALFSAYFAMGLAVAVGGALVITASEVEKKARPQAFEAVIKTIQGFTGERIRPDDLVAALLELQDTENDHDPT